MIYVDGASNTYGDELDNPETQSWPGVLSTIANVPVFNNASKGKSNQHIIFDTINYCAVNNPTHVIIAFAPIARHFFIRRENNYPVDISIQGSNSIFNNTPEFKEFHRLLFKFWSNYLYSAWEFLQNIVILQSFLKCQNIPYTMVNSDNQIDIIKLLTITKQDVIIKQTLLDAFDSMDNDQITNVEKQINKIYNLIDHDSFYDFSWYFKKLSHFTTHPNATQHIEIANFMFTLYKKNK